jgi:hypothetical protein
MCCSADSNSSVGMTGSGCGTAQATCYSGHALGIDGQMGVVPRRAGSSGERPW